MAKKSIGARRKFGDKRDRDRRGWARNGELANYLNVSKMTLWRWKNDPDQRGYNFPRAAKINNLEFNDLDKVDAWMEAFIQGGG